MRMRRRRKNIEKVWILIEIEKKGWRLRKTYARCLNKFTITNFNIDNGLSPIKSGK
jgi:hypothetical protein